MKCINCGCENSDTSKFCKKCGQPMQIEETLDNPVNIENNEVLNNPVNIENKKVSDNSVNAKNKQGILLIVLLSVIIVIGIIIIIIMVNMKKQENGLSNSSEVVAEVTTQAITTELPTEATIEIATTEMVTTEMITTEAPIEESEGFIFPDSDTRYISKAELQDLSKDELAIARNEIYARHGYIFTMEEFDTYFRNQDWYEPSVTLEEWNEDVLNDCEKENRSLILEYEKEMGYVE